MQPVTLTVRSDNEDVPPFETQGYAPTPDCPLAVTKHVIYDFDAKKWNAKDGWKITHRPTCFHIGKTLATLDEALAVLMKCEPDFPAWPFASRDKTNSATQVCKLKAEWAGLYS